MPVTVSVAMPVTVSVAVSVTVPVAVGVPAAPSIAIAVLTVDADPDAVIQVLARDRLPADHGRENVPFFGWRESKKPKNGSVDRFFTCSREIVRSTSSFACSRDPFDRYGPERSTAGTDFQQELLSLLETESSLLISLSGKFVIVW